MKLLDTSLVYKGQEKILVAVDCIIFGFDSENLKLLLFKRKVEPLKGAWSLIGAFIKENLSLNDAAKQVLLESTGLKGIYMQELQTYSDIDRDPGERVISVAHYSLIRIDAFELESVEKYDAHWFDLDNIPDLIFDHRKMVDDAINKLRAKARYQPIGFELLPEKFTIPQLQILYQCVYQKKLDDRNFRKKILSFDILTKTEEKDKTGSKKGAFLYKFNREKFDKFIAKGYNFEL
ncbi:MAG: DNA mismatch repair protein MutT [Lutibacter sp.]|uniref:NUDIX hydrolase n=1 Tax=Lutibacter sp. TaxID=1925666 RepID=UPI0019F132CD|nr:NUDIX domain-containing protein [Lutibacter sp.]NOR27501.1 DNA mismatch repair protein MutT [Lutibacter sp.]